MIAVSSGAPALTSGETMIALPYRNANTSVSAPIAFSDLDGGREPRAVERRS